MNAHNANVKSEEFNELQAELILMKSKEDDTWVPEVSDQDLFLVSWL